MPKNIRGRVLLSILVLAILGALGTLGYTILTLNEERFTEFYILNLNGEAEGYPSLLVVGEEGEVVISIVNQEGETANYRVEVRVNGVINNEVGLVTLRHDEKWREAVGFTPDRTGDRQKVEFLLYKQGQKESYLGLHLWINVQGVK